jgi:hypothetical protein
MRKANVEGVYEYQRDLLAAKTPEEAQALFMQYRNKIFKPASDVASEQGRMLQAYNKEIGLNRAGKAFGKLDRNLTPREMKEFGNLDLNDADAVKRFAQNLGDPKKMDYVYEFWYNSILSGIPTHVVNVASNTGWRLFQVPHRALTGAIDKSISVFRGGARDRYMSEALPLWGGFATGKGKAAKSAWQMMRHQQLQQFETKWAKEMGSSLGAFKRSPNKTVRAAGEVITIPTRALRAMDVYANSLAYDGQMRALARRAAIKAKIPRGAKRKAFEKRFRENPSTEAHNEAMEFAKYSTFMSDPGKISSAILKFREGVPPSRFVIPFVNTIGNLLKRGVEMTPGVGLGLSRGQKPAEVIAKQIEGSLIAAYVYHKMEKGEMTGAAPENINERDAFYRQGKKAWGVKVGDNWYQYRRVEPFNTVLASSSIFYQRINEAMAAGNEEGATKAMGDMANDFKNNLIDSSYLQGVTKVLNRHGATRDALQTTAASMVPFSGFWRSMNRAYEAHMEGSAKVYDHRDIMAAFGQVIPGLYKLRDPKLNVWGEEVELQGGVFRQWLPYKWAKETDDPTEKYLEQLERYPGLPNQRVKHKGIEFKLDDDIYRQFIVDGGSKLKTWLDKRVTSPKWKKYLKTPKGRERQSKRIGEVRNAFFAKARHRAIKEQLKRGSLEE